MSSGPPASARVSERIQPASRGMPTRVGSPTPHVGQTPTPTATRARSSRTPWNRPWNGLSHTGERSVERSGRKWPHAVDRRRRDEFRRMPDRRRYRRRMSSSGPLQERCSSRRQCARGRRRGGRSRHYRYTPAHPRKKPRSWAHRVGRGRMPLRAHAQPARVRHSGRVARRQRSRGRLARSSAGAGLRRRRVRAATEDRA